MSNKVDINMVRKARQNLDEIKQKHPDIRTMDEETLNKTVEANAPQDNSHEQVQSTYSPKEAARILNTHKETILRAIRKGELKAALIGKLYRITQAELDRYFKAKGGTSLFE